MAAKFYIYRNLNTGGFSIRYKGRVIERAENIQAFDVVFKVNPGGYLQSVATKQRNVHAFVVCSKYQTWKNGFDVDNLQKVSYNPFIADQFMLSNRPITKANRVVLTGGKCYVKDV